MTKNRVYIAPNAVVAVTLQALLVSACSNRSTEPVASTEAVETTESPGLAPNPEVDASSTDVPDSGVDATSTSSTSPISPKTSSTLTVTPQASSSPVTSTGVTPTDPMPFRGVNLAGGEFGTAIPGVDGVDYTFPNNTEMDSFVAKGMNTFRIGFRWERLQPQANGEFVAAYAAHLDTLMAHAAEKKVFAILDPHNFARYYDNTIGSSSVPNAVFADFWRRLALRYKDNPYVMFNLVNEPHDISTEVWVSAANDAIAAIRAAGATNTILAPGNAWTGAYDWTQNWYGTSNSVAMLNLRDPLNNTLFEVHQYLDASFGGSGDCVSRTIGSERIKGFVSWLRDNGKKGFLGEFAGINSTTCQAAVNDMLTFAMQNTDVLEGWLWWAAGPGWGDYSLSIEPKNGVDRPQMSWLSPFLTRDST